ncbi:MAG: hypothetical protein NWE80_00145, partial [Candidatus Bathyarchaeota archaeon]|nr:hypothetical protein [Candidatus Bathyarchaeota archaeon]
SSTTNPEISAFFDNDYQEMLELSDEKHQLFFSPSENEHELPLPFFSENKTSSIDYGDTWANITVAYEKPNFELIRSMIVGEEKSSVDVVFQIIPKNVTLRMFKMNLWALFETTMEKPIFTKGYKVILPKVHSNGISQTNISILETNGEVEKADVFVNPLGSTPVVSYSFKPLQDNLYVRIKIVIGPSTAEIDASQKLDFYYSYDLIEKLHVDYILQHNPDEASEPIYSSLTHRAKEWQRFHSDSEHFTEVFSKGSIIIFKTN